MSGSHKTKTVESSIKVRSMTDQDAAFVLQIHYDAVHIGASEHYPEHKLDRWSPPLHEDSVEDFLFNPDNEIRVVAEMDGEIVGFGCLVVEENELRACYVSPKCERRGVGQALVAHIEKSAREAGLSYLQVTSSLNAEAFYEAQGYSLLNHGVHMLRGNEELPCAYMRKDL